MTDLTKLADDLEGYATFLTAGRGYNTDAIREAARILRAADAVDVQGLIELAAKAIYDQWADQQGWVEWVPGGNSMNQDEARRIARADLESALRLALAAREGFVMVPVEPTPDMLEAGAGTKYEKRARNVWRDMIAAAAPKGTT